MEGFKAVLIAEDVVTIVQEDLYRMHRPIEESMIEAGVWKGQIVKARTAAFARAFTCNNSSDFYPIVMDDCDDASRQVALELTGEQVIEAMEWLPDCYCDGPRLMDGIGQAVGGFCFYLRGLVGYIYPVSSFNIGDGLKRRIGNDPSRETGTKILGSDLYDAGGD